MDSLQYVDFKSIKYPLLQEWRPSDNETALDVLINFFLGGGGGIGLLGQNESGGAKQVIGHFLCEP